MTVHSCKHSYLQEDFEIKISPSKVNKTLSQKQNTNPRARGVAHMGWSACRARGQLWV
jgi:hypothetical protein